MTLKRLLYLTQLEEYNFARIQNWLKTNPGREVVEIKQHLVWTTKIKFLNLLSRSLFFLPPTTAIFFGLRLLTPFDWFVKEFIALAASIKIRFLHRRLTVIAITGSWGKTTSKDTLLHLIKSNFIAQATTANHNTLLGVSFDVLRLPLNTRYFICEIGAYHPGEISKVCRIVRPKIAIVTAVGPMHLERFGGKDYILKAKMELPSSIPKNGHIYLPEDLKQKIFRFHFKSSNVVFFKQIEDVYQSICRLLDIECSIPPSTSEHRLQIIDKGNLKIIDDTYNSNPVGFTKALSLLKSFKSKNNILVTPGMIELGELQSPENAKIIKLADSLCQHLVLVGQTNREAFKLALTKPKSTVHYVDNIKEAQDLLPELSTPDTAILFENDLPDHYF